MPRVNDVMQVLPGSYGVPNTPIESAKYNAQLDDLVADANAPRPIIAGGTGAGTPVAAIDKLSTVGANIASASTTNLAAASGNTVTITGTGTINSLGAATAGIRRQLIFAGAATLTYNATSMILPGAANIVTAAGDTATALSLGGSNWRVTSYTRAAQVPVNPATAPAKATLVDADAFLGTDSEASSAMKRWTWATLKAAMKTALSGSAGFDADTLDGQHGSYYRDAANMTGTVPDSRLPARLRAVGGSPANDADLIVEEGFYFLVQTTSHIPEVAHGYMLQITQSNTTQDAHVQIWIKANGDTVYMRQTWYSGAKPPTWQAWKRVRWLESDQDARYLQSAAYTAADVLAKLLTVDGAGSALDADLLDGQQGAFYLNPSNMSAAVPIAKGGTGAATAAAARTNLGLGGAAVLDVGTAAGTVAAGNDGRITGALQKSGDAMSGPLTLAGAPTAALHAASKAYVDSFVVLSKVYESAEQTITIGGTVTLAHGLGAVPKVTSAILVCKTAEQGFAVGDQIACWGGFHTDSGTSRGCHIAATSTQLKIQYSNQGGSTFQVFSATGGVITLTNANWNLIVRAYA